MTQKFEHICGNKVCHFISSFDEFHGICIFYKAFGNLINVVLNWFVVNWRFASSNFFFFQIFCFSYTITFFYKQQTISLSYIPRPIPSYLWTYCESSITHSERLCYEQELGALIGSLSLPSILLFPCVWKFVKIFPTKVFLINNLAKEEINVLDFELKEFNSCMKHQVSKVFLPFIFFMHGVYKKKRHNMLAFMLDPMYKITCLVTTYLGHDISTTQSGTSILK